MPQNKIIDCLFILSAPRSGSSVLAGCLHHLGVELGSSITPAGSSGHSRAFENRDITLVHDILLRDLGCSWDMLGSLPQGWPDSEAAARARKSLEGILESSFKKDRLFAIKDPRLCRLMPLWQPLLESAGLSPGLALVMRHPWETALSLRKNHDLDLLKAHLLWLIYNREALGFLEKFHENESTETASMTKSAKHCSFTVTFDQLLADSPGTLGMLQQQCSLSLPRSLEDNIQTVLEFIRPEFKNHHAGRTEESADDLAAYAHFASIYNLFRAGRTSGKDQIRQSTTGFTSIESRLTRDLPYPRGTAPEKSKKETGSEVGTKVFDNFLTLISSYEKTQREMRLERERCILSSTGSSETLYTRIMLPDREGGFTLDQSRTFLLPPEEWYELNLPIPDPELINAHGLLLGALNTRGMVNISRIEFRSLVNNETVWKADNPQEFKTLEPGQDLVRLPVEEPLQLLVCGPDPRLSVSLDTPLPDSPLELRIWIKAGLDMQAVAQVLQSLKNRQKQLSQEKKNQAEKSAQEVQELKEKINSLEKQLQETREQQAQKAEELQQQVEAEKQKAENALKEKDKALAEKDSQLKEHNSRYQEQNQSLEKEIARAHEAEKKLEILNQELQQKDKSLEEQSNKLKDMTAELKQEKTARQEIKSSLEEKKKALKSRIEEIDEMWEDQQKLEDKHYQLELQFQEKQKACNKLEEQLQTRDKELQQSRQESDKTIQALKKDLGQEKEKASGLKKQLDEKAAELEKRDKSLSGLKEQLQQKDKSLEEQGQKIKKLSSGLEKEKSAGEEIKGKLEEKEKAFKSKDEELNKLREDLQQAGQASDKTIQALKKDLGQEKEKASGLKKQLDEKSAELEQEKAARQEIKSSLDEKAAELEKRDKSLSDLKKKLQHKDKSLEEFEQQYNELKKSNEQIPQLTLEMENAWQKSIQLEASLEEKELVLQEEKVRSAQLKKELERSRN
ncbi:hypothetical protein [Desulfonatronospira sp.]|uniref:hypothetical protein n=1 Tax=Desulfonatronospira sp. TaxID=1962951 RepID=UPI0025C371F9|nr:hypothetical protein [Desulfonatronospira sp.]